MKKEILSAIKHLDATPAYVFDLEVLNKELLQIRNKLDGVAAVCYAMKANPFLIGPMKTLVHKFEVCSPGEFEICKREQIPMDRIVLSGVNKDKTHIEDVLDTYMGEGIFTIESKSQIELLELCACQRNIKIDVLIRVTSGNQFGLDEEAVCSIVENRAQYKSLQFQGLQFYSGTQKKKIEKIEKELRYLDDLCHRLKTTYGYEVKELEYGPGFYVDYFSNEEIIDKSEVLDKFVKILKSLQFTGNIMLEMGRFVTAACGYYISKIIDQKTNQNQNYCIVDGGINHVNYYGQAMAMKIPRYRHYPQEDNVMNSDLTMQEWNICGSLCTVGDVLVKKLTLQNARVNDILVFENIGAYSITEGIYLFLSRKMPKVFFYSGKKELQLVRDSLPTDTINSAH